MAGSLVKPLGLDEKLYFGLPPKSSKNHTQAMNSEQTKLCGLHD